MSLYIVVSCCIINCIHQLFKLTSLICINITMILHHTITLITITNCINGSSLHAFIFYLRISPIVCKEHIANVYQIYKRICASCPFWGWAYPVVCYIRGPWGGCTACRAVEEELVVSQSDAKALIHSKLEE